MARKMQAVEKCWACAPGGECGLSAAILHAGIANYKPFQDSLTIIKVRAGLIGGINQTGNYKMDARFSRNDLIRRIEVIAQNKEKINLSNLDAEQYLVENLSTFPQQTLIYFGPPYYEKASGLYLDFYRKKDHSRLAEVIQALVGIKWLLSYDSAPQIIELYNNRTHFTYDLQYSAATTYKGKEVLVFSDNLTLPQKSILSYIDAGIKTCINLRQVG